MTKAFFSMIRGFFLVLSFVICAGTATAQSEAMAPDVQQLIELLENPDARDALIASLKDVATPAEASTTQGGADSVARRSVDG